MEQNFISQAYKNHRVMPFVKSIGYAVYKIAPVLQERVANLARNYGFIPEFVDGSLVVNFGD